MSWMIPAIGSTLIATLVMAAVYWAIYRQYRDEYLRTWAFSWSIFALRFIFELLLQFIPGNSLFVLGHQLSILVSGFLLLMGAYAFLNKTKPGWVIYVVLAGIAWVCASLVLGWSWTLLNIPNFLIGSIIYIWTGTVILRSKEIQGFGKQFTGFALILWGIHKLNYPFLSKVEWFAPWGYLIAALLEFLVASGTILIFFERTRHILSTSEERFRLLADNAKDLIFRYKLLPVQGLEYISPSSADILGYLPQDFYEDPKLIKKLVHPEDKHIFDCELLRSLPPNEPIAIRMCHKDGRYLWIEQRLGIYQKSGDALAMESIGRDITERKLAEDALKRYELLSKYARDVILFLRADGQIAEVNEAALKAYGYSREELLKMNITELRAPESHSQIAKHFKEAELRGIVYETFHKCKDGSILPVEVSLQGTVFSNERVFFGIVRDISERKQAEKTINHLAYHDSLTDLPNRILFFDRLQVALSNAFRNKNKVAVMFLDLDRFKNINDMMGHAVGDSFLQKVARRLEQCVRATDTVARMGGDEFTILLPELNLEQDAGKVAKKIIENLKLPWKLNGHEFQITASIGIAIYPNDGEDAETLTKNADTAMYRAKEQGDVYQFFTSSMNTKAIERLEMEISLRKALDNKEFELYYQPQVDISKGQIVGMEALVRWYHPEKGMVLPMDFISVAEDTGLIKPIGEWVLQKACIQNMEWQKAGFPTMRMAVNISANQFRQKDFVNKVAGVLEETGMDPELLELEITESTAMQDVELSVATLKRLRDMGIRIAIDDFGTGYSSLNYLRRFPITTLKVDRTFVTDVLTDVEDAAIVATIIVLAQNLRLNIIIEGVETDDQLSFFEQQECFEMQGYLFSEPVPSSKIEKMLKKAKFIKKDVIGL